MRVPENAVLQQLSVRAQLRVGIHTAAGVVQVGVPLRVEASVLHGAQGVHVACRAIGRKPVEKLRFDPGASVRAMDLEESHQFDSGRGVARLPHALTMNGGRYRLFGSLINTESRSVSDSVSRPVVSMGCRKCSYDSRTHSPDRPETIGVCTSPPTSFRPAPVSSAGSCAPNVASAPAPANTAAIAWYARSNVAASSVGTV